MSKKDFEKIYQLHCSEDESNVALALQLIKPRMTKYIRWVTGNMINEITKAWNNSDYNFNNDDLKNNSKAIRIFGFISRSEDDKADHFSYILRMFRDDSDVLEFIRNNIFWDMIFKKEHELDFINSKLRELNRLIIDDPYDELYDQLFQLFKCILTKEIYERFKPY